jgi:hypothetical protein
MHMYCCKFEMIQGCGGGGNKYATMMLVSVAAFYRSVVYTTSANILSGSQSRADGGCRLCVFVDKAALHLHGRNNHCRRDFVGMNL